MYVCVCMCRFTGSVKLKGIALLGGEEGHHPQHLKLQVYLSILVTIPYHQTYILLLFLCYKFD